MLRYRVPIALAVLSFAYFQFFHSAKDENTKVPEPPALADVPAAATPTKPVPAEPLPQEPAAQVTPAAEPGAQVAEAQTQIREEILRIAPRSTEFNGLPDGDREWVVEEAIKVYSYGQIKYENLGDYIHELSSTRYHAIHEREQPMMTEENFEVADESQPDVQEGSEE